MEGFDDAAGGEGGAGDGIDLLLDGFLGFHAVPALEESGVHDLAEVGRGLVVVEQGDGDDLVVGAEGDHQRGLAVVALDAVAGRLGVDDVAEEGFLCVIDVGAAGFFLDALGLGEGVDNLEGDAVFVAALGGLRAALMLSVLSVVGAVAAVVILCHGGHKSKDEEENEG